MSGTGFEHVTVVRGGTTLLRDVSLQAADGELLVVLGSSGSGKSTLLRALAGLDQITSGTVLIKGRDVTALPPRERHVAMVFEASALIPFKDVAGNLGWGLKVQRVPEEEVKQRVSGRARQLRLSRLLSRRPGELSAGERGLVGLGHALVQIPDVFLLDEPLAGLDTLERTRMRREIADIVRNLGVTTLFVTHDQVQGLAVADRVALLHEGSVVQVGTPRELYERPVNMFAAAFIGTPPIGLLDARLVSAGDQAGFAVGDRSLPLWRPVPPPLREYVGLDVVLGLRAEDVHDGTAGHDPDSVTLDGVVRDVEYTGQRNVVTVELRAPAVSTPGSDRFLDITQGATLRSFFPPHAAPSPGTSVRLAVQGADAHVFDPLTGQAIWHPEAGSSQPGGAAQTP